MDVDVSLWLGVDVGEKSFGASTGGRAIVPCVLPDARWHRCNSEVGLNCYSVICHMWYGVCIIVCKSASVDVIRCIVMI